MKMRNNLRREPLVHAMTCDVEDYFQVSAFSDRIARSDWDSFECRIPRNMERILELLDSHGGAKATFFTLGWVAQKYPQLVRAVADAGHEIASHGMQHVRVRNQSREEFFEDVSMARKILQDTSGQSVSGYRAASWSIDGRTPWAHEALAEAGYLYSSSIYPISHDHFGMPSAPVTPHFFGDTKVLEVPASVVPLLGRNVPAGGGGYFRLFPLAVSHWLIGRIQRAADRPYVFYFHPWELDPQQPRINADAKSRFRHYLNLKKFESRFTELLKRYRWDRMDRIYFPTPLA